MTPKETRIAAVILTMVAAGAGLQWWGMRLASGADRIGPIRSLSVAGQEQLAVFHANQLHLLDGSGRRLGRQPLADLLLTEEPNDMDWTLAADGKAQAWFFEDTTPRLVRCELAADAPRLERCAQVAAGAQLKVNPRSRAVHIAVDAKRSRVFVADAKGHAVRALSLDGRVLAESASGMLFFPNRLRLAGDALMVADNDHRRLVWLDIRDDKPSFALRKSQQSSEHPQARSGHTKVTDFAFLPDAGGEPSVLWMLAVAQGQKAGDVLSWGAALKPVGRASLGGFADPLAIDRLGDSAIVADFGVALYRVGAGGEYLGPFGDQVFQRELRSSRDRIAAAGMWTKAAWGSFAATLVIGFLLAWRYSEKPGQRAAVQAFAGLADVVAEIPRAVVELKPQAWVGKQAAVAAGAGALLMLLVPGLLLFAFPHEIPPSFWQKRNVWLLLGLLPLLWVGMGIALWYSWGIAQRRLVLANGFAQVLAGDRTVASAQVREVVASPQALLIGRTMLPYRSRTAMGGPGRWIYDEDKLTRFLLAHLPASQRVPQPELARAVLKRTPLWLLLAIGLPFAAFVAFELWQAFGR
jgi:hypothetical protein